MPTESIRPKINPSSIATAEVINLRHRNLNRVAVIGGIAPGDRTHVHLGTPAQILRQQQMKQGIDPRLSKSVPVNSCSIRHTYEGSNNFLTSSRYDALANEIDLEEVIMAFWNFDEIAIGPYASAKILGESPLINHSLQSLWSTFDSAFGMVWRLQEMGQTS